MNVLASIASLPLRNSQPVTKQVTRPISDLSAPISSNNTSPQVNVSVGTVTVTENSTYSKPVNQSQAKNETDANIQTQNKPSTDPKTTAVDQNTEESEAGPITEKNSETEKSNNEPQEQYSEQELKQISELKLRDQEVIAHERAHSGVGGQYAGAPNYSYRTGPDGIKYAVSGEVSIDTSRVPGDPQATLQKAQQIKSAALAPAEPSGQDRRVAAKAEQMASRARADIMQEQSGVETAEKSSTRSNDYSVPEHFTGVVTDNRLDLKAPERRDQINDFYHNSSIAKNNSTFQTEI